MTTGFLCGEIYVFGIIILTGVSIMLHKNERTHASRLLERNLVFVCAMFFCDFVWSQLRGTSAPLWMGRVANAVYFMLFGAVSYLWYYYIVVSIGDGCAGKRRHIAALPAVVLAVFGFVSIWTGWLFTVEPGNVYVRGPLHFVQPAICFGYCIVTFVHAVIAIFRAESYEKRSTTLTLLTYVLLPVIGAVGELFFVGVPLMCPCTALAAVWVYVNRSRQMITRDPGTGMNNRYQLFCYLDAQVQRRKQGEKSPLLWALMLDLDDFKSINDTYGHLEGDHALELAGGVLKAVCGRHDCFGARYGGDEFVLVIATDDPTAVKALRDDVTASLDTLKPSAGYGIHASVGTACWNKDMADVAAFLRAADSVLYEQKRLRKVGR